MFLLLETKEDRAREIDPKLLFPLKKWLYGFLPDHKFSWEIDESQPELKEFAHKVLYTANKLSADNTTSLITFLNVFFYKSAHQKLKLFSNLLFIYLLILLFW